MIKVLELRLSPEPVLSVLDCPGKEKYADTKIHRSTTGYYAFNPTPKTKAIMLNMAISETRKQIVTLQLLEEKLRELK